MRLLRKQPRPSEERHDHNPELIRGPKEECLATWWHQATPGTTYWRCLIPARHLPGQSLPVTVEDLAEEDGKVLFPRMRGETAIFQFLGDHMRSRFALGLRTLTGTRILMEVDDNYTMSPPKRIPTFWTDTIEESLQVNGYSFEGNRVMAREVDGIICSTEYLADVYSDYNDNVWVCQNSIDPDDWDYPRAEPDGVFRIVYYGSQTHFFDTPLVTKALKWAARQPGVEIWTVGVDPPDWNFPRQKVEWTYDLVEARKPLFRFDLGIAPLTGGKWANGKSDVKALEYAMAGVMPLVSRAEPYRPWWDKPDFVVENDGWQDAIRWAVANQDEVRELAEVARHYVMSERTIHTSIQNWREAIL